MLWKQAAQQKWLEVESGLYDQVGTRSYRPKVGLKLTKAIGYDAEEPDRREHGDTFRVDDDKRLYEERGIVNPFSYWFHLWNGDGPALGASSRSRLLLVPFHRSQVASSVAP